MSRKYEYMIFHGKDVVLDALHIDFMGEAMDSGSHCSGTQGITGEYHVIDFVRQGSTCVSRKSNDADIHTGQGEPVTMYQLGNRIIEYSFSSTVYDSVINLFQRRYPLDVTFMTMGHQDMTDVIPVALDHIQ